MNLSFQEALTNGIRRDNRLPRNNKFLTNCRNISATEFGLRVLRNVVQPISDASLTTATITKVYPFPQLFRLKNSTFLLDEDAVYLVTEDPTSTWTLSALSTYDLSTFDVSDDSASAYSITGGRDWHVADAFGQVFFTNGVDTLFSTGSSGKIFGQSDVTINSCATFNDGRMFLGGFDESDVFSTVNWPEIYADYKGDFPSELSILADSPRANWVWFSDIGMSNLLHFFHEDYMKYMSFKATPTTSFTDDNPFWKQVLLKRESFFMPMPSAGTVVKMAQLGNCMIVYSTDGIHTLVPYNDELVKTFGHREVAKYGQRMGVKQDTYSAAAAGGDEQIQAFIAENNDLYMLMPDGTGAQVEYLGYRQIFSDGSNWLVHYDPSDKEFHFTASDRCYRLRADGNGLVRAPQIPTTVFFGRSSNTSRPIGICIDDASPTTVTVQTDWFDAGPGTRPPELEKVIINSGTENVTDWTISLEYRLIESNSKSITVSKTADARGNAQFDVSGSSYRLTLTHPSRTTSILSSLEVVFGDGSRRNLDIWRA
jgi:hypothetical protein